VSAVHGVVILADQRWEAPIIQAIQSRSDCLAIVRRCADLAEVIAAARAGIADLAVIDGADPDLTSDAVASLRSVGMSVVALAPHEERSRLRSLCVASVAAPGSPDQVVNSLIAATRARRPNPTMASAPPAARTRTRRWPVLRSHSSIRRRRSYPVWGPRSPPRSQPSAAPTLERRG